ncbi:MAG: hypothetical protein WBQ53_05925 [Methylocystis sp.]
MIDTNEKTPGRAPKKDMTALSNALRENLRRRKARAPMDSHENIREERAPAPAQAPEDEAKWTR